MFLIAKIESTLIAVAVILLIFFPGLLIAQHDSYKGIEAKFSENELLTMAGAADYGDNISAKIFEDEKNTYFAVDIGKLSSEYEKIRILELSYADNALVNIGSDKNMEYYLFLVNNTLNISSHEIIKVFDEFKVQSISELQVMNNEQLRLWLIQHDKYSKK
ncbi:MAG: hypothetical protein H8E34_01540 [Bacteroidetes bacterium]|nr:hypothetical protein [Bacteroidota bacterium]MBL6943119.1 hypothetical protein [Bacteroidales bacterium]